MSILGELSAKAPQQSLPSTTIINCTTTQTTRIGDVKANTIIHPYNSNEPSSLNISELIIPQLPSFRSPVAPHPVVSTVPWERRLHLPAVAALVGGAAVESSGEGEESPGGLSTALALLRRQNPGMDGGIGRIGRWGW